MSDQGAEYHDNEICRECGTDVPKGRRIYDRDQLERVHAGVIPKEGEQPRCPDCAPSDQSWRDDDGD